METFSGITPAQHLKKLILVFLFSTMSTAALAQSDSVNVPRSLILSNSIDLFRDKYADGVEWRTRGSLRFSPEQIFHVDFEKHYRSYIDQTSLDNNAFGMAHTLSTSRAPVYGEYGFLYSPEHEFLPEWRLFAEPHYVFPSDLDAFLRYEHKWYSDMETMSLAGGSIVPWKHFVFRSKIDLLFSPEHAASLSAGFQWNVLSFWRLGLFAALGNELVDVKEVQDFSLAGASAGVDATPSLKVDSFIQVQSGNLRDETRGGLSVQWVLN